MAGEMGGIDEAIQIMRKLQSCSNHDEVNESVRAFEKSPGVVNGYALAKLKRKVSYLTKEVEQLAEEGHSLKMLLANRGIVFQIPKLAVTTAMEVATKILDFVVAHDEVRKIGVYGMGGVGKTTVMNIVNNQLIREQEDKFDRVIWVPVTTSSGIKKLQDDIARQLNLELSKDEDVTIRALSLFSALQHEERYVLILDNMWERFHLDDIGIPEPSPGNGCKLVLTTQSLIVCNFMKCHQTLEIRPLSKDEAWELFLYHVGEDVVNNVNLKGYLEDVERECACLPLAIKTVASAMAGKKEEYEWRTARDSLKANFNDPNDEFGDVIKRLRFSYDNLKNEKHQKIVLCCTLYPANQMIVKEELLELLIDEEIVEGMQDRQSQLDEGRSMLKTVENVCLLQSATDECVKMHDLIRDMALQITTKGPHRTYMVEAGLQLKKLPEEEKWIKNLLKVSLMSNNISKIHHMYSPNCPDLSTLMLQNNRSLSDIPDSFFKQFVGLKVLNLSNTNIQALPNSVSSLTNLAALSLSRCRKLDYLPSLNGIKGLRKLDLHRTLIDKVPEGLEELTSLRFLNVSDTRIDMIPNGTLSKLHKLEFLSACVVPIGELLSLQKLETFEGALIGINSLNQLSKHMDDLERRPSSYFVVVLADPVISEVPKSVFALKSRLKQISCRKSVMIFHSPRSKHVSPEFPWDIEHLLIDHQEPMHIPSNHVTGIDRLQWGNISCLKELINHDCRTIKEVFPLGILSSCLKNLELIMVAGCEEMVDIAGELSEEEKKMQGPISSIALPKLLRFFLENLPKLTSICPTSTVLICDCIREINIEGCKGLKRMPFELALNSQGQPSSLERIVIKEEEWNLLEWNHTSYKTILRPFCKEVGVDEDDLSSDARSEEEEEEEEEIVVISSIFKYMFNTEGEEVVKSYILFKKKQDAVSSDIIYEEKAVSSDIICEEKAVSSDIICQEEEEEVVASDISSDEEARSSFTRSVIVILSIFCFLFVFRQFKSN